jgi:hypothetical protein
MKKLNNINYINLFLFLVYIKITINSRLINMATNLIKEFQKRELKFLQISYNDQMSFDEARELIDGAHNTKNDPISHLKHVSDKPLIWTEAIGIIVNEGPNRAVKCDIGLYYISNFEKNAHLIDTGKTVKCRVCHPAQHRGVAIDIAEQKD